MRTRKRNSKFLLFIKFISALATAYLLYSISLLNGIENKIRILLSVDLVIIYIAFLFGYHRSNRKHSKILFFLIFLNIIYVGGLGYASYYINKAYKVIDKMTTDSTTYSTSLVTLKQNEINDIKDIGSKSKIGIIAEETNMADSQLAKSAIRENNLKNKVEGYNSYVNLIDALYSKKVEYVFLPSNYVSMFKGMEEANYKDIDSKTKVIYKKNKVEQNEVASKKNNLSEPFTVLIMGVDSEKESLADSSFNGDALMLVTFNPKTLNTTMLSIPRDSYVPIACFQGQKKNKITHAAWYGEKCMMNTISNFTGIDIDYYYKINFKGLVNIVDSLGGVEVDVPYSFCEQDSNRRFGKNTIYVREGKRKLNGEQALAFSRNRKSNSGKCSSEWTNGARNDFIRGQNQQLVLRAILNKAKTVKNLNTISNTLDKVSDSMSTNMTTNEILSLYNVVKDIIIKSNGGEVEDLIGIQKLYLSGRDAKIYDSHSGLNLYNYVLYDSSIKAVSKAMKINLGKTKPTLVKEFSFDVNKEYKEEIIGKVSDSSSSLSLLPSFIGMTEAEAKRKASNLGIAINFTYVSIGTGNDQTVIKQSQNAGIDASTIKTITLTVLKKEEVVTKKEDKTLETETAKKDTKDDIDKKTKDTKVTNDKTTKDTKKDDKNNTTNIDE